MLQKTSGFQHPTSSLKASCSIPTPPLPSLTPTVAYSGQMRAPLVRVIPLEGLSLSSLAAMQNEKPLSANSSFKTSKLTYYLLVRDIVLSACVYDVPDYRNSLVAVFTPCAGLQVSHCAYLVKDALLCQKKLRDEKKEEKDFVHLSKSLGG